MAIIALVPLVVAVLLVAGCGNSVLKKLDNNIKLDSPIGHAGWDFSTSFATNVTVIGSVLGVILSAQILPSKTKILPSSSFAVLSVFFGIIVLVAAVLQRQHHSS